MVERAGDIFGATVNIAARIAARAAGGQILVTEPVADEINAAVTFADLAGFTALTEAHGDIVAADIAERFVAVAESIMGTGDRLVKAIGDAVLITSDDAASGLSLILRLFDA